MSTRVMVSVKAKHLRAGDWVTVYGAEMAPRVVEIEEVTSPSGYGSTHYDIDIKGRLESFSFKPNQRVVVFR